MLTRPSNAPDRAKADLQRHLVSFNVRKTIATHITSQLSGSVPPDVETSAPPSPIFVARAEALQPETLQPETLQPETGLAESMLSEHPPPADAAPLEPLYVHSSRELDDMFREMAPHFEGRESEQNWLARDKSTLKLRRLTKGNAPTDCHAAFVSGVKALLDGIVKVANTLRTTMSSNGCQLVQELARTLGSSMDAWAEILLQNFVKMCAGTKQISSQNGNATVDTLFSHLSYTSRLLQHVSHAAQDKNVQPRMFAAGWAKTFIRRHKSALEHSGGLDAMEKIVKKGLADANPKVREGWRGAYWTFALVWPQKGEAYVLLIPSTRR